MGTQAPETRRHLAKVLKELRLSLVVERVGLRHVDQALLALQRREDHLVLALHIVLPLSGPASVRVQAGAPTCLVLPKAG